MYSNNSGTIILRITLAALAVVVLMVLPAVGGTGETVELPAAGQGTETGPDTGELPVWFSDPAAELCLEQSECNNPSCNPDEDPDCVCDPNCDPKVDCDCVVCEGGGTGGGLDPVG